ncbi:MAG: hypothetical protein JOS17DRAFT_201765 [Linnemannia elongata]|nr:MAG: hypothetical protein JOS17DRAFT_201765 [Linnemannia elongata]
MARVRRRSAGESSFGWGFFMSWVLQRVSRISSKRLRTPTQWNKSPRGQVHSGVASICAASSTSGLSLSVLMRFRIGSGYFHGARGAYVSVLWFRYCCLQRAHEGCIGGGDNHMVPFSSPRETTFSPSPSHSLSSPRRQCSFLASLCECDLEPACNDHSSLVSFTQARNKCVRCQCTQTRARSMSS